MLLTSIKSIPSDPFPKAITNSSSPSTTSSACLDVQVGAGVSQAISMMSSVCRQQMLRQEQKEKEIRPKLAT
eukprot:3190207-Rhodomonas_salina.1